MAELLNYLTAEGLVKLREELDQLRTVKRPQVARDLKDAIEEGDLSENAGYEESKRDQAFVEGRIKEIEAILSNYQILEGGDSDGIVRIGSRVTVVESGYPPETYQIVGAAEADPTAGRISNVSPLGKSLLGCRVADRVDVESPGGVIAFEIQSIE